MRLPHIAHRKLNTLLRLAACLCCLVVLMGITLPAYARLERYLDPDKITSLSITYRPDGVPLKDVAFRIYRVASVDEDSNFTLLAPFDRYSITFRRDMSSSEWQSLAETLAGYVAADGIPVSYNRVTNAQGVTDTLYTSAGLYLVLGASCDYEEQIYTARPSLIVLPNRQSDGWWQYDVEIAPKWEKKPIVREDLTVVKVWSDSNYSGRPTSIEVELFCDGQLYKDPTGVNKNPVTLNRANNWRYTWKGLDTRNTWTVVERSVPAGYTVSVNREGTKFVVTNTRPTTPTPPPSVTNPPSTTIRLPQTGLEWWPIPVLALCGMLLFVCGWLKQRQDEA